MTFKLIDHGFFRVSRADARVMCGGHLPRPGTEKLVRAPAGFDSEHGFVWLGMTNQDSKAVWSIRDAGRWRLNAEGQAILS